MKTAKECQGMGDIRTAIDCLDAQIVQLIASRAEYVRAAAQFKDSERAVKDAQRVTQVLQSKRAMAEKLGASPDLVEQLYTTMIEFFITEEMKEWEQSHVSN